MPRLNAVQQYMRDLNDSTVVLPANAIRTVDRTRAMIAADKLPWANSATQRAVLAAVDEGAPMHPQAWSRLAFHQRFREHACERWQQPEAVFADDANFSVPRAVFALGTRHSAFLRVTDSTWTPFKQQIDRMLRAGQVENPDDLLQLVEKIKAVDVAFAIRILANSSYEPLDATSYSAPNASLFDSFDLDMRQLWPQISSLRATLGQTRWLKNAVTADEYATSRELSPSLRQALYAPVYQSGYAGYRQRQLASDYIK